MKHNLAIGFCVALLASVLSGVPALPQTIHTPGNAPVLENGLTTSVVTVKSSGGKVVVVDCHNPNVTVAYVQVFDTTATVTVGVTVPKISVPFASGSVSSHWFDVSLFNAIKAAATRTATGSTALLLPLDCNFAIQ